VQARIDLLLGLGKNLDEITGLLGVCDTVSEVLAWRKALRTLSSEQGDGGTVGTSTTGTTNAMNVILRVVRVVVVEHMSNVADILKRKVSIKSKR
jgi:hypothetical protein